ncbi:MAG: thylakoid membrane photosystem I accumulation factor [Pseudanabaenaceae cyanobacterium bins.68]|nr:thylakoid membrane photosystem I accumulation factor [Pseudanabaenaceae cyanobacterium bins.68]
MIKISSYLSWVQSLKFLLINALGGALALALVALLIAAPAAASLKDDHYDGNIFALYGGNGSIVPPRVTISQSWQLKRPALLVFYADDSADCKLFSPILNDVQAFYGKSVSIIPIPIDSLNLAESQPTNQQPEFYYRGYIPQTVIVDPQGQIQFDQIGQSTFAQIDQALQEKLGISPVVSPRLKARDLNLKQFNEINP